MLSTLVRYDGWFLLAFSERLSRCMSGREKALKPPRALCSFLHLGRIWHILWLLWNQLIFKDALYFAFGPYSARSQQIQLEQAGVWPPKAIGWFL